MQAASLTETRIVSVGSDRTNIIVTAAIGADIRAVYLESRSGLESAAWEPRAIQRLEVSPGERTVVFRLPMSSKLELLRLRSEITEPLPSVFYQGQSEFGVPVGSNPQSGILTAALGGDASPTAPTTSAPSTTTEGRAVVESDIWQRSGDTLFFFNQYRGLQVIDVSNPDAAVVRGTYPLAAAGEQMYVYDPTHIILLAGNLCGAGGTDTSKIVLLDVTGGSPRLVSEMPVPGQIRESRLVGKALYVVSEQFRMVSASTSLTQSDVWQWGSTISSFDLNRFDQAVARSTNWVSGYNNAIMATDRYLFVAAPHQVGQTFTSKSDVSVFDIASPNGTTRFLSSIAMGGVVKDKFKMNLNGDVLAVVSENSDRTLTTKVETFWLANPGLPQKLGELVVITGETLYATRFDGTRLYAVTFRRVDPLWIIDLSNPSVLRTLGHLEIPGYSTYIEPMGDRLLTIGIDTTNGWRTSVQLFNVANPISPTLLSKVLLGDGYSSSEANVDEKALAVLPDQNLAMVPFTSYSSQGTVQGLQLIDLEANALRKRGVITQSFQIRRATTHRNRILSVSGFDLYSVNATDRDRPTVTGRTELAWQVDRLFVEGNHLVELGAPWDNAPSLRVASTTNASQAITRLTLDNIPVLGATVRDHRLYVLQGTSTEVVWPLVATTGKEFAPVATNDASLLLSVFDLTALPNLTLTGRGRKSLGDASWSSLKPLWPKPGLLVWVSEPRNYYLYMALPTVAVDTSFAPSSTSLFAPWWGYQEKELLAFDVNTPSTPRFESRLALKGDYNWWSFSDTYAANGLVYSSHQTSEYDGAVKPPPVVTTTAVSGRLVTTTNDSPPGSWIQRYYLDVVNYEKPADPSVRKPTQISGSLIGLSSGGQLLFTQGSRYGDTAKWTDYSERIDALAYDGVAAHLVDSIDLPTAWPHPALIQDGFVFLGRPAATNQTAALETWSLSAVGKFNRVGNVSLNDSAQNIASVNDLLTLQLSNKIAVYDRTIPAALTLLGSGGPDSCIGFDLESADGDRAHGLWLPLSLYGATRVVAPR